MEFKKKLKQRLYIGVSYIALGLILILTAGMNHFRNSFFVSFGVALLVMGILRIFKYRKVTRDPKNIRKQELAETDERTRMISEKAKSWAFSFSMLLSGVLVIVLNIMGFHDQAQPFAWYVCGMVILYWVFWVVLGKKY